MYNRGPATCGERFPGLRSYSTLEYAASEAAAIGGGGKDRETVLWLVMFLEGGGFWKG